jgi:hypothetical protein
VMLVIVLQVTDSGQLHTGGVCTQASTSNSSASKGDGFGYFDKEVEAYLELEAASGRLVPTPLFVSESWMKFIGLQLGRDPLLGDEFRNGSTCCPLWRMNMAFVTTIRTTAT